ncbi:MAG: hypothetical protein Tsb0020_25450 [Haliangiales bacterium]
MPTTDNRKSKRNPVTLRIKFKSANLEQFIERYAVDVSQGGIFIRTREPLPIGTTLRFEFQLRDESPLITGEGTVVWIREHNPTQSGVAPGMGVRFDRLTDASQSVLGKILTHKAKRAQGAGVPTQLGEVPTRVVPAAMIDNMVRDSRNQPTTRNQMSDFDGGPTEFAAPAVPFQSDAEAYPEEAFEQATKVHSLDELASMAASIENDDSLGQAPRVPADGAVPEDSMFDDADQTRVYPANALSNSRPHAIPPLDEADARVALGHAGATDPLPPTPLDDDADLELGLAGYEADEEQPEAVEARDVELGLAGPTNHKITAQPAPGNVELGAAGSTLKMGTASAAAKATLRDPPGRPIPGRELAERELPGRAHSEPRNIDLGHAGGHDDDAEVPLPEAGKFDLGLAGPTSPLAPQGGDATATVELGAAGSGMDELLDSLSDLDSEVTAQLPAAQRAALDSSDPAAAIETEVANRVGHTARMAAQVAPPKATIASPAPPAPTPPAAKASAADDDGDATHTDETEPQTDAEVATEAAAADSESALTPPAAATAASRDASVRVNARRDETSAAAERKPLPLLPLLAAAALILVIVGGALYIFSRDDRPNPNDNAPAAVDDDSAGAAEPAPSDTPEQTSPTSGDVAAAADDDDDADDDGDDGDDGAEPAAAADADAATAEPAVDEPEEPVELVEVQIRTTPRGATVEVIDGDQTGPTPITLSLDKSRSHRVRISHPGYLSQELDIDPATPKVPWISLQPTPWRLTLSSTPDSAFVYVDGRRVPGVTPVDFDLPSGWEKKRRWKISFRLPGYEKLNLLVTPDFTQQGEVMVQSIEGTMVKRTAPPPPPPPQPKPTPAAAADDDSGDDSDSAEATDSGDGDSAGDDHGGDDGDSADDDPAPATDHTPTTAPTPKADPPADTQPASHSPPTTSPPSAADTADSAGEDEAAKP